MRAFVFPDEAAFVPHVGAAPLSAGFFGAGFKGEKLAVGVGVKGGRVVDQSTDVDEMALGNGHFLEPDLAPLGNEFLRRRCSHLVLGLPRLLIACSPVDMR